MFFALEPRLYRFLQIWTGLKKRLLSYKLAATNVGAIFSPHSLTRDEVFFIRQMEWIDLEENQPAWSAIGGGGLVLTMPL